MKNDDYQTLARSMARIRDILRDYYHDEEWIKVDLVVEHLEAMAVDERRDGAP